MSGCFHVAGVFCDNCRTGMFDVPHTYRYYTTGVLPASVSVEESPTRADYLRLELEVLQLREEISRMKKLFEDAIRTNFSN